MPTYIVYGLSVSSPWVLDAPKAPSMAGVDVLVRRGTKDDFTGVELLRDSRSKRDWFEMSVLADGTRYLRWTDLADFLVRPAGDEVVVRPATGSIRASFEAYLFNQVLSFALIQQGREPLHATVVERNGSSIGLVGLPGAGKSTFAATLLARGFRLVTDDLLLVDHTSGSPKARPGLPRLKLYPKISAKLLPTFRVRGQLNGHTAKSILAIPPRSMCSEPVPLAALVVLRRRPDGKGPILRQLTGGAAFAALTTNTFNPVEQSSERLTRHVPEIARIIRQVPVKALHYRSGLAFLDAAADRLERELA